MYVKVTARNRHVATNMINLIIYHSFSKTV